MVVAPASWTTENGLADGAVMLHGGRRDRGENEDERVVAAAAGTAAAGAASWKSSAKKASKA